MKTDRVVLKQRTKRCVEIHLLLVLIYLTACNTPLIQKSDADDVWEIKSDESINPQLSSVLYFLQYNYLDTFSFNPLRDKTAEGLMQRLDPYSCYMSKQGCEEFKADLENGSIMQFGFRVWIKNDTPFIFELNPYSIARKNGLCIGDKLLALDSVSLVGRSCGFLNSIFDTSNQYHYTLTILRPGENISRSFAIRKSALPGDARSCAFMLDTTTGYFWFSNFDKGIADKAQSTLSLMRECHPQFSNLIIDLRWNCGGYVDEAIALLSLFYSTNALVIEERSVAHPEKQRSLRTSRIAQFSDLHLIVLVNEHSYSASELFAGALQDWDKALIIGQQTGGKGLVMQNHKLTDGSSIYFACAKYYLPSGRCVQVPYEDGIQKGQQPESDLTVFNLLHNHEKQFRCNDRIYYTASGRPVYDEMGIIPDVLLPDYSNGYAIGNLDGSQRFEMECDLRNRYQKLIIENSTFESFKKNFPIKEAAKYIGGCLKELTSEHFTQNKIEALAKRTLFYIQMEYYGLGTQTSNTLEDDKLVCEAKRILSVEAQNAKRELAANAKKENREKSSRSQKLKKLAVK